MSKVIKRGTGISEPPTKGMSVSGARIAKKPIIEREEVDARKKAHDIVIQAEHHAQRIREEAEAQADETRQRGFEEGRQEGLAETTSQIAQALLQVEKLAQSLEPSYIRLVRSCVEEILGEELKVNPEAIVGIVRRALRDARQQREITVRVHPQDVEALRRNDRRLLEMLARANNIDVREDASVARGGCIIVTELGTIDASLDKQLEALELALQTELADALPQSTR